MAAAEPLHRLIQSVQFTDAEIKRIAKNASKEADAIMARLADKEGIGAAVKSSQVAMAKLNAEMWANIADATKVGIGDAVWNATEMQALFDEQLFAKTGMSQVYWRQSMIATAKTGVDSLISRKINGISLSEKVYKNSALSKGIIDKTINNGLALGMNARDIAKSVVGFIDPATPGGASYAAMRLGRTEVANAFHTTAVRRYQQTPWVQVVKWSLSGSHPAGKVDECNDYADSVHFKGGEAGQFLVMEVPGKPHPNCLCYVEPVVMDLDQYIKNFKAGKYDDYINKQMGCSARA